MSMLQRQSVKSLQPLLQLLSRQRKDSLTGYLLSLPESPEYLLKSILEEKTTKKLTKFNKKIKIKFNYDGLYDSLCCRILSMSYSVFDFLEVIELWGEWRTGLHVI